MTVRRHRWIRPAALYLGALGLAAAGAALRFDEKARPQTTSPLEPPAAASAPHAVGGSAEPAPRLEVTDVHGSVERSRAGAAWAPVSDGMEIGVDESLRTAPGASARLRVGDKALIGVAERSEVTVRELTRWVHRFGIQRGRMSAHYGPDGKRVLRVEGEDGSVVETREGQVGILDTGAALVVAAETGSASVEAEGKKVEVGAGHRTVVHPHAPPADIEPIPVEVLLRMADGDRPLPGDRTAVVRGRTDSGARLWVNDVAASVDEDGTFAARIPVHDGKNRVVAIVEDALGRRVRRVLPPIVIEPSGEIKDLSIRWGTKGAP